MPPISFRCSKFLLISESGASRTQTDRCGDVNRSFHAARVRLTDNNRISAAAIDFLSHLYLMLFKGQSHFINGSARPSAVGRRGPRWDATLEHKLPPVCSSAVAVCRLAARCRQNVKMSVNDRRLFQTAGSTRGCRGGLFRVISCYFPERLLSNMKT